MNKKKALLIAVAIIAGLFFILRDDQDAQQNRRGQANVKYIEVEPTTLNLKNELPGRVVSYQVAEIRPQVTGIIQARLFDEGAFIKEGEQLYQIDPARYEADYQSAEATLEDAEARLENAKQLVARYDKLIGINAVSKLEYDNAKASFDQAKAGVSLAKAGLQTAKINLDYTKVYAPISGYIGPSMVTKGALVTAQQEAPLVTIRQLDPVYVDLSQASVEAKHIQERLMQSRLNKQDEMKHEVTLFVDSSTEAYPYKGILDATDLSVDAQTGSIRLRSVFPNPNAVLLPGMFVRAYIDDFDQSSEIILPQKNVRILAKGQKAVWVLGEDGKAHQRFIETGPSFENNWVIRKGLQAGDKVIIEGAMGLREGQDVSAQKVERQEAGKS